MKYIKIILCCALFFLLGQIGQMLINGTYLEDAQELENAIVFLGNTYEASDMPFSRDIAVAKTQNRIKVYGVQNDEEQNYLVCASTGVLYRRNALSLAQDHLTGIFSGSKYCNEEAVLSLFSDLYFSEGSTVLTAAQLSCNVLKNTKAKEICLCFEPAKAAQERLGYLIREKDQYIFVPIGNVLPDGSAAGFIFTAEAGDILNRSPSI